MFITFEGSEGCGKTTHTEKLKTHLEGQDYQVVLSKEPGGTELGQKIREVLLHSGKVDNAITELLLFASDRAEHVSRVILPALRAGKIVISDRFIDSTLAYQVGGSSLPEDLVRYMNMISSQGIIPDITILLDISVELGLKRAQVKGAADRFEKEKIEFHKRVREKYLEIALDDEERVKRIDMGDKKIDQVQEEIRKIIDEKLRDKR